jgi:hypothetical protein
MLLIRRRRLPILLGFVVCVARTGLVWRRVVLATGPPGAVEGLLTGAAATASGVAGTGEEEEDEEGDYDG